MASIDANFNSEIFRKNRKVILSSNRQLASILGVRLAYDSDGYEAGTVLAFDANNAAHAKYNDAGASGVQTAVGVLLDDVLAEDFSGTGNDALGRMIIGGEVFEANLVGLDAAAKVDLKSRTIVGADGVSLLKF